MDSDSWLDGAAGDALAQERRRRLPAIEAECRAWKKTRERPHPPMPGIVQYVIRAGETLWTGIGMARLKKDVVLDWPPTKEQYPAAEWNDRARKWQQRAGMASAAYEVVLYDKELYQHLYNLGLLAPPAVEIIDNHAAPGV